MQNLLTPPIRDLVGLQGKVAIVTGGAMGIGRAIVFRLAEAGAKVVIADLDPEAAAATAKQVDAAGGVARVARADVSNPEDVLRTVDAAVAALGRLDILVNNAGIFPMKPLLEIDERTWDATIAVNLTGAFLFAQAAAREMAKAGRGGAIVNVASIDAFHPTGNLVHYDASKGGVLMMTRSLALELAKHKIRVNGVAPGGIATEGTAKLSAATTQQMAAAGLSTEEITKAFTARTPLGRFGQPDDIAKAVLFLASELAGYMTGETIVVDGGYLLS